MKTNPLNVIHAKASGPSLRLALAFLPAILAVVYLRWKNLPFTFESSSIREVIASICSSSSTQITKAVNISTVGQLRDQYAQACPEYLYKTRIFSMDPLIIYLEDFIPAKERQYILTMASRKYEQSLVGP